MSGNNNETKLDVKDDEKHLLLDHSYDGIQELNHPLPSWWNVIFYVSVAFGFGYFIYYQLMAGPTLREEFKVNYGQVLAAQAEFKRINSAFNQEHYNGIVADEGVKKGQVVFENNCMPCHNEKAKGDIGPNLTDEYWLVAKSTPETIYGVVFNGSEANGMPAWAELLTKDEIYQAVAYVSSLKNTHQPGGKEPQGEKIEQ
ncbi:MAG: cbb3-type cytochrome c oxidase N-terminal domain-containing protein [Bacteriovoracaceae bacterium]